MKYDRMDVAVGFLVLTFIVGTVLGVGALTKKAGSEEPAWEGAELPRLAFWEQALG